MTNAILVHGTCPKEEYYDETYPTLSNAHWFPWLSKQLQIRDIPTVAIEVPNAFQPHYADWKKEFERFDVNERTLLVGHSCGAAFLLRWLSENKVKVNKVLLVAPWLDPHKTKAVEFMDFTIDPDISKRTRVVLFNSTDDYSSIQKSVNKIREELPDIYYKEFTEHGHFCFADMKTDAFPEALDVLLN